MATPPWLAALNARSAGLNARYNLPRSGSTTPVTAKPPTVSAEDWARAQAQRYIDAQLAVLERQKQSYMDELQRNSQLQAERGQALAQALQQLGVPERVQGIYGNASHDIAGLAQGFSGNMRDQAQADAAQQTRMVSGTGQEGAVRNEGVGMADVTYGAGGYIPARTMSETGAAFASQAALEPGFAMRIGQQDAMDVYNEGLKGLDEFTDARMDIEGQRFDMEQELLGQRADTLESQAKLSLSASDKVYKRLKDQRDFYVKQQYLAIAQGNKQRADQYAKLAAQREQRMVEHENRLAAKDRGVDMNGNVLPGYKLDANGNVVKATKPKASASPAVTRSKARQEREQEFDRVTRDLPDDVKDLIVPATTLRPAQKPSYQVAFRKMWTKYKYLLRYGSGAGEAKLRARITKLIDDALASEGITKVQAPRSPQRPSTVRGGD